MTYGVYTSGGVVRADTNATPSSFPLRDAAGGLTNAAETCTQLTVNGSISFKWNPQSGNYSLVWGAGGDGVVYVDTTSASVTLTLPAPGSVGAGGMLRIIKKVAANSLIINPNVSETINGAASKTITAAYTIVTLFCDGTNWVAGSMTVL